MNILSFDIEEWALEASRACGPRNSKLAQYDQLLTILLNTMDQCNLRATCFCTGKMAELYPTVIRQLQAHGHEIACHSYVHNWCNKMTHAQFEEDTHAAISALEQCIGQKIKGYRAPAFSITEQTPYAFEILTKNGIEYDASVFPAKRDFGGWPSFGYNSPTRIIGNNFEIKEFPVPTIRLFRNDIAYSGGGYFRLFPYTFIRHHMQNSDYSLGYFHINDLIAEPRSLMTRQQYEAYFKESGTLVNRLKRYIKANLGTGDALTKLQRLLNEMTFVTIQDAIHQVDWSQTPIKKI